MKPSLPLHGTTILAVRHRGGSAMAGDGQITLGSTAVKHTARKIRRLHNGRVLAGFAGSTADAMALFTKFEAKIEEYRGNLERAAVELSKEWRTDRVLRRLEAFLVAADRDASFLLSGAGDVIAPDDGIVSAGSGAPYALAAARALARHTALDAGPLALEAMKIAAGICIYTNDTILVETL
jgi:ATP-dependent HslUV protease, peptidase subunit HslV